MLLKANTNMHYFNLNAKGRQKKSVFTMLTLQLRELCIAIQLCCLPSFWTYIKTATLMLHTSGGHNHHP